jgi:exodeoxyribonuclease VII large subunit
MSEPLFNKLFDNVERRPLTVSQLTGAIRTKLESSFNSIWVEGEISNFKSHSSGHWYFTLKDSNAQLHAKCFRSANQRIRFRPADGLHVRARGKLTVYPPRGEYELVVETLDPVGAGALRVAFDQLRDRLKAEGLFANELKRPLPVFPRRVGVVTSPTGAAIRDILNVISRRTRTVHVLFSPAKVQGDLAGPDVARAIRLVNLYHERALRDGRTNDLVDVLIVGRGGGSAEDLWAFNTEEVARAIRKSAIPVISAVGHETDFTIADFVADHRAPTPSAAAEIVAAHEDQVCASLDHLGRQLERVMRYKIVNARSRVQHRALSQAFDDVKLRLRDAKIDTNTATHQLQVVITRTLRDAQAKAIAVSQQMSGARLQACVASARNRFETAVDDCQSAIESRVSDGRERLALATASLDALSPLAVLHRGYAIARDVNGKLLRDAAVVEKGDRIEVLLAKGSLSATVEGTAETQSDAEETQRK